MHYKPCSEIIGGARALLPMEDYAYAPFDPRGHHNTPNLVGKNSSLNYNQIVIDTRLESTIRGNRNLPVIYRPQWTT